MTLGFSIIYFFTGMFFAPRPRFGASGLCLQSILFLYSRRRMPTLLYPRRRRPTLHSGGRRSSKANTTLFRSSTANTIFFAGHRRRGACRASVQVDPPRRPCRRPHHPRSLRACMCACVHAYVRSCVRACVCACMRACVRACMHAYVRACVILVRTHTDMQVRRTQTLWTGRRFGFLDGPQML